MGIQPTPHQKARLFSAPALVLQLLGNALLELSGNRQKWGRDCIELLNEIFIYGSDAIDPDIDAGMNVSIGNTLRGLIQSLEPLVFKLFTGGFLCHGFQYTLNIGRGTIIGFALVVVILFHRTANRFGNIAGLLEGDAPFFFCRGFLLSA